MATNSVDLFGGVVIGFTFGVAIGGGCGVSVMLDYAETKAKAAGASERCIIVGGAKQCEFACPGEPWKEVSDAPPQDK